MKKEKVLIVGGGFGGIKAALELDEDPRFSVTLLTNQPVFHYYPTLYRAATGGKKSTSFIPLESVFENKDTNIAIGTAQSLDRKAQTVTTDKGDVYQYDTLILAMGVITNYFGIPGLSDFSYGIKSVQEVTQFKQQLHQQLIDEKKPDMNYVVVGGGPTGIELAGALPSYIQQIMKTHGLQDRKVHVDLVEASPRLLPRGSKLVSTLVKRRLQKLGVRVHLGKVVQGQDANHLTVSGKPIQSHTVVWTAGITNNPFFSQNNFVLMGRGKVATDVYLQAEPNIYVIGDNANTPYSGMAQTAVLDGEFVAHNLQRKASGKNMKSYVAIEPWSVIPVGKRWAVATRGKFKTYGITGYFLREAADIMGYLDYYSVPAAGQLWLNGFGEEETCRVCTAASAD